MEGVLLQRVRVCGRTPRYKKGMFASTTGRTTSGQYEKSKTVSMKAFGLEEDDFGEEDDGNTRFGSARMSF